MSKNTRKYLIAGNWKLNKTASEASDLVREINLAVGQETEVGVCICPPFTALETAAKELEDSNVQLGAQNMHPKSEGAYTGEISPVMLRSLFCNFVILGHSERREYFNESDAFINEKTLAALESNLKPILCVGETLEQRDADETTAVVQNQLKGGLLNVTEEMADHLVIAYEPVWAIGTGKTATPEMAQDVHKMIRDWLKKRFNATVAGKIRILYGGSMKPNNASDLLDQPDIDGGLIGGASLFSKPFVELVKIASTKL
jgi:triosephosphate isomerase|tara:strand:+ start:799 stop:1575 length:777 start_codon:yes stop_codon:yes gene_type:complete